MAYKPKFGSKRREDLWQRESFKSYIAGTGNQPICNLCGKAVHENQDWHESHDPSKPRCLLGKSVGIAHADCNLKHGREVVTPMLAKAKRQYAKHVGIKGPGLGRHPMRAGRRSKISKTISGRVVSRLSLSEKLAAMRAKRAIGDEETTDRASPRPSIARLPNFPFQENSRGTHQETHHGDSVSRG